MTDDEANALWNGPKCARCDAMEVKLKATLDANLSWAKGYERLKEQVDQLLRENVKLKKYVQGAWGQA